MRPRGILLCALMAGACGSGTAPRPNVLLIVVDTLRRDHLSCYGYERETSPNVDRLAATGWRFDRAVSQAPWTTPSVAALMTSRYPTMLGIVDLTSVLPEGPALLSEVLREHGYHTAAVVSHRFCSSEWGFARGFDAFDESNVLGHFGVSSPGVTERALELLDRPRDGPFFLWLHYFDPHNQYIPHRGHEFGGPAGAVRVTPRTPFRRIRELAGSLGPAEVAEVVRYYDSEVAFTDRHVGRVLDRLGELGIEDETVVVFTADHGEELFDHGDLGHAHSLHRELVHVPLIVRFPGEAPRVIDELVSSVDVMPTLLDHLGIEAPEGIVGRSLLDAPARSGGARDGPAAFSETSRHADLRAVFRGRWKLVRDLETGEETLYELTGGELEPVTLGPGDDRSGELDALRAELDAWIRRVEAQRGRARELELTPELDAELRELGYVE